MKEQLQLEYEHILNLYNNHLYQESYLEIKKILIQNTTNIHILNLIGIICTNLNKIEEAKYYFQLIITLDSNYINAYINLANLYQNPKDFELAKRYLIKVLNFDPANFQALNNLSLLCKNTNRLDNATKYALKALSIKDNAITKYNLSLVYLANKQYKKGFNYYRARYDDEQITDKIEILNNNKLLTSKMNIKNKTILIYNEQGFGDMIQFIRFLPLIQKKCKKLIVQVNPLLKKLFRQSYPKIEFVDDKYHIKYDYHLPLMELGYLLKVRYTNIPYSNNYLDVKRKDSKRIAKTFLQKNKKINIGIVWRTNAAKDNEVYYKVEERNSRSIDLKELLQYLDSSLYNIYSLQKDTTKEEEMILKSNNIQSLGNNFILFYDNALVIDNLDILVGIDTTSLILAGAMGKQTLMLLPEAADWRWGINSSKTNWFNSIHLVREKESIPTNLLNILNSFNITD